MRITNKYNLPEPLVRAVSRDPLRPKGPKEIGVSELIAPTRITILRQRHDENIVEDASDRLWALMGSSVHYILGQEKGQNALVEERLEMPLPNGFKLIGHPDLLDSDGTLDDYKMTSVWAFVLGDKPEWEAQLNVYASMYRYYGFTVKRLRIIGLLKDWKPNEAQRNNDYPPANAIVKEIPLWSPPVAVSFIEQRAALYASEMACIDPDLALCTDEERWAKPDIWAVKKKGQKRAVNGGLHKNEAEARQHALEPGLEVEYRAGEDTRCMKYCNVSPFCDYWKERYGGRNDNQD